MAKILDVDVKIARTLLDVSVTVFTTDRSAVAERIIRAVMLFRADIPHAEATLGCWHLAENRLAQAADVFKGVLVKFPHHQLSKALLALVHAQLQVTGWRDLCAEVINDGRDNNAIELARSVLARFSLHAPKLPGTSSVPNTRYKVMA